MIRKLVGIFLQQVVDKDAEQQCAGNRCDCDLAECQGQTADTGDQDRGYDIQVLVDIQVDALDHLQTGDGNESIQGHAHTAHDAGRNGGDEGNKR